MKAFIIYFICFGVVFINQTAAQCDKLPEEMDLEECCNFPDMSFDDAIDKIVDQLKDQHLDGFMMACKVSESLFKELKLTKGTEIDDAATQKYIDTQVHDPNWKPVTKAAVTDCLKYVSEKKDAIAKILEAAPFNIKKDKCNASFVAMGACYHFKVYQSCPKDQWTESKKCSATKDWIVKCSNNMDIVKAFGSLNKA
ncbi:CLUMA_CG008104, isoform A [Clunio marinus]|uniref:CLUMA_CG008104, isoform A n=1 Tax=Clunio marinus TaxID=568069 RepID=A0A1J1I4T2_9DIPT|nr:CLUMA_CG008104, isoform A [Clunio marinus]